MNHIRVWRRSLCAAVGLVAGILAGASALAQEPAGQEEIHSVSAADYHWDRVSIGGGGFATGVLVHPRVRDLVYVRQDVSGLYRYDAWERRWRQLDDFIASSYNDQGSDGFAIDPGRGQGRRSLQHAWPAASGPLLLLCL